jgi:hypothetical protein
MTENKDAKSFSVWIRVYVCPVHEEYGQWQRGFGYWIQVTAVRGEFKSTSLNLGGEDTNMLENV